MLATLSETEALVRRSVLDVLTDRFPIGRPHDRPELQAAWKTCAEFGWLAAPFPEERGGFGTAADSMLIAEPLGRHRLVTPFAEAVVLAGGLLGRLGDAHQQAFLDSMLAGERLAAPAIWERGLSWGAQPQTRVRTEGGRWILNGAKAAVRFGPEADAFLVSAMTDEGLALFLIPADAAGLERTNGVAPDGPGVSELDLTDVHVLREWRLGDGPADEVFALALDEARAALCAEAVGAMWTALDMTVAYLKTRRQFGAPLSSLQALQHRAADMYVLCQTAEAMALDALSALDRAPGERSVRVAAAKAYVGGAGRRVGQEAIQLHGGIGMSREYAIGHYLVRLTMIDHTFGSRAEELVRFAAAAGVMEARQ